MNFLSFAGNLDKIGVLLMGAIFLTQQSSAQIEFSPATFADDPRALQNRLDFPDLDEDVDVIVRCIAPVTESGVMRDPVCFNRDESNSTFFRRIIRASRGSKLNPAIVNGRSVRINMFQFTVRIQKQGDAESIVLYPNHLYNTQYYGDDYIAAQSYGVGTSPSCNSRTDRFGDLNVRIVYTVDANGEVGEEMQAMDNTFADCVSAFKASIRAESYIPAHYEGKPVDSVVVQLFHKRP